MRTNIRVLASVTLTSAVAMAMPAHPAAALQSNPAHTHIGHVLTGFGGTPDGAGLLPTARAEIEIAVEHLNLAQRDPSNLDWTQTHAAHVLHAMDPSQIEEGPGLGFGCVPAAEGIVQHIELAASSDGASDNVTRHAAHVSAAATAVAERCAEMAEMASRVGSASDYTTAQGLIERMGYLANEIVSGRDLNDDGQIGWGDGEGGLEHVEQHMGLMADGEGLE